MSWTRPAIIIGGLSVVTYTTYRAYRPDQPTGTPDINPLRTPGVQNIEGAYQKGGATATHTKAYGGTKLGQKDDIMKDGGGTARPKGFEADGMGDEQRAHGTMKGKVGEKFDEMKYGSKNDK